MALYKASTSSLEYEIPMSRIVYTRAWSIYVFVTFDASLNKCATIYTKMKNLKWVTFNNSSGFIPTIKHLSLPDSIVYGLHQPNE